MRLLVVSNRLPITVTEKEGKLIFQESPGGLVSGLSAYLDSMKGSTFVRAKHIWVGWPGIAVEDTMKEELRSKFQAEFDAYPVFVSENAIEKFYHGFCNKTIWPIFQYFPSYASYNEDYWAHYKRVNETFCDGVMEIIEPEDVVWIHDYHLMLLPKLLREKIQNPIGFFLHIPFPSYEIFRLLPGKWRSEILEGLLGADLIGFHTQEYTQYFLRCVLCIQGYENEMGLIIMTDHIVKAETFPMGIDFQKYHNPPAIQEIPREKKEFKKNLAYYKVILSIDRLDYTKGVINRLYSYELFLERNPDWRKKIVLVLVLVPSRIGVEHYQQLKKQIEELIGKINGKFGDIAWTPILYQYKYLPFNPLIALYSVSDVCLITPLRDGMNLIAKEYIAARSDKTGVLILSEMAGAAKEMGEAIIINPNNIEEITGALKDALEMPEVEQIRRNEIMQKRLKRYDVIRWVDDFIKELLSTKEEQKRFDAKLLNHSSMDQLIIDFNRAKRRLIFLDYDGTLVPFAGRPQMAKPDERLLTILKHLSEDQKTEIVLISGRDKDTLQRWFDILQIEFVAEHGVWIKGKNEDWRMIKPLTNEWKPLIVPILELYTDRLPGSFVEEKEFSVVWHYRKADPELGSIRAKELIYYLVNLTTNKNIQVLQGNKVVEITNAGVSKGAAGLYRISKNNYDFILAIGDDWTDEDLFRFLPEKAYSIRVGMTQSYARFNLHNHTEVLNLIEKLINTGDN